MKAVKEDLKIIWTKEHRFGQKVKMSLGTSCGNHRQAPRPMDAIIELRFGVFAILNVVSFAILGIFIPFFLAEGLPGEAIVQSIEHFRGVYAFSRGFAIAYEGVRDSVHRDFKACVANPKIWSQTDCCVDLRNTLPPYRLEDMNLTDPVFTHPPYRFLTEKGDASLQSV